MEQVVVIGGGASGMMAAVFAARNGAEVTVLEQGNSVGKKILSTGNGKCNFTNISQNPGCYRGTHPDFAWQAVSRFPVPDTIRFFVELGIYSKNRNGYLYPYSEQASAVRDVFRMELARLSVRTEEHIRVTEILPEQNGFQIRAVRSVMTAQKKSKKRTVLVKTGEEIRTYHAGRVILAAGGMAAPGTGSDGSGLALAKKLGHHIVPCHPALVQLRCAEDFYPALSGVRAAAKAELLIGGETAALDMGEIQFTEYGISGIPVFQISRYASEVFCRSGKETPGQAEEAKSVEAELDFMPDFTKQQFLVFLKNRIKMRPEKRMASFFTGLLHEKLSMVLLKRAGLSPDQKAGKLTEEELLCLLETVKGFRTTVTGTNGFEQAQVSAGGIDTDEIVPETMESKVVPGLYFAGEIMDVDGMCGGYNLQWAWSSGYLAGCAAAGKEKV